MPAARLLIVDNALDHELYRPVEHWSEMLGFSPDSVHVPSGRTLPAPDQYNHIVISGCEGSIIEMPPWAKNEAAWLREAIEAGAAVLGSCWGHQLIAVVFAGPDAVRKAATPEFGWVEMTVKDDGDLLPSAAFQTFTSHFDEVVAGCHPELRILAGTTNCAVQAARWGDRPVWGIQPHPEINPAQGTAFLTKAAEIWPHSASRMAAALAGPVRDSGDGVLIAKRFLETPAG